MCYAGNFFLNPALENTEKSKMKNFLAKLLIPYLVMPFLLSDDVLFSFSVEDTYHEILLSKLPAGKKPSELLKENRKYFYEQNEEKIEFRITPAEEMKDISYLKFMEIPYVFRFLCFHQNDRCSIFLIEKTGSVESIKNYYTSFLKKNKITKQQILKESAKQEKLESGNTIKETYQLIEVYDFFIELYLTTAIFPEDVKKNKKVPLQDSMNIDIRIFSKKYNPGISKEFFLKK